MVASVPAVNPADTVLAAKRRSFFSAIPGFAADLDGEPYALFSVHSLDATTIDAMRAAAADAYRVLARTTQLVRTLDDAVLCELGYPPSTLGLVRMAHDPPALIARVDLIFDGTRFRAIEINADTPGFIIEAHAINGRVCAAFGSRDPNDGTEALLADALARACAGTSNPVFTALGAHIEDRNATEYLVRLARERAIDARFIALADLRITANALLDDRGKPIDCLYRNYPIELFAADRDEAGEPIGPALFDLVERGQVRLLNSPAAFAMQNKAVYAIAWELYERNAFFSNEERAAIERTFVPTWFEPPSGGAYVRKPVFGREGDSVTIVEANGTETSPYGSYLTQPTIAQRYVPMPQLAMPETNGTTSTYALHGCFLVDGVAGALALRLGGRITSNASYFQPIGEIDEARRNPFTTK